MRNPMKSLLLFALMLCVCISCAAAESLEDVMKFSQQYADQVVLNLAERAEQYQPKVKTLANGVQVQRTPSGADASWHMWEYPISYNNYHLNADNRGCAACHDLAEMSHSITDYPHPDLRNEIGIEVTAQQCLLCHENYTSTIAAADRFSGLMHAAHGANNKAFAALGGDCWSCHYATDDFGGSDMQLWDNVKHQILRGITRVSSDMLDGTFSWNQEKTVSVNGVFDMPWMSTRGEFERAGREASGMTPNPETDGIYDTWTITVNGDVGKPTTMTINEWIEAIGLETTIMTSTCQLNPMGGTMIANCEITGLNMSKMFAYCEANEDANVITQWSWVDWNEPECTDKGNGNFFSHGRSMIEENGGYLVLEIGGEPLRYKLGYPVMSWIGGTSATYHRMEVREITLSTADAEPGFNVGNRLMHGDEPWVNVPNVAIAELAEGQIIPAGEPHTFEGYAFAIANTIKTIELSFDQGATWVSFDIEEDDKTRWVWWNYEWTPPAPGAYTISVRGTTDTGEVSAFPVEIMFNAQLQ